MTPVLLYNAGTVQPAMLFRVTTFQLTRYSRLGNKYAHGPSNDLDALGYRLSQRRCGLVVQGSIDGSSALERPRLG